ncbi:hypothetical protein IGL98_000354 [Enterococcus sp. DIV0840]|uniref:hypothetical protein n=1 Tax=unclassified Enterococcus TaxID=2608891 RepID=UPI0030CB7B17
MRAWKWLFKVIGFAVASFCLVFAIDPQTVQHNVLTQEVLSVCFFLFVIMFTWRWVGRFVKGFFKALLAIFFLTNK